MQSRLVSTVAIALMAYALGAHAPFQHTVAQEESADSAKAEASKPPEKLRGRVPDHYGKVGLTDKQRQEIYRVQAKYRDQIEELQKQIQALEKKRDTEVEEVLTPAQKKLVEQFRAAAKERAEQRRKKQESS